MAPGGHHHPPSAPPKRNIHTLVLMQRPLRKQHRQLMKVRETSLLGLVGCLIPLALGGTLKEVFSPAQLEIEVLDDGESACKGFERLAPVNCMLICQHSGSGDGQGSRGGGLGESGMQRGAGGAELPELRPRVPGHHRRAGAPS
jgi:hypothetical protein